MDGLLATVVLKIMRMIRCCWINGETASCPLSLCTHNCAQREISVAFQHPVSFIPCFILPVAAVWAAVRCNFKNCSPHPHPMSKGPIWTSELVWLAWKVGINWALLLLCRGSCLFLVVSVSRAAIQGFDEAVVDMTGEAAVLVNKRGFDPVQVSRCSTAPVSRKLSIYDFIIFFSCYNAPFMLFLFDLAILLFTAGYWRGVNVQHEELHTYINAE